MRIYTKTGDGGETGLFGGPRVSKDHARVEAAGTVDELNCSLGVARAAGLPAEIAAILVRVQHELFALGAELSTPDPSRHGTALVHARHVAALEADIDRFEAPLAPLAQFILPAGLKGAAQLHLARAICRRAERRLVALVHESAEPISGTLLEYLNRLSDLLFVLARSASAAAGFADESWQKPAD